MNLNIINANSTMNIKNYSKVPSFGLAKLNDLGKETADTFQFKRNNFLNSDMYKKQGFFDKSLLAKKLDKGEDFSRLCKMYGCTKNAKDNADFIKNQILTSKSSSALKQIDEENLAEGLKALYYGNFDNPELSVSQTKKLLEMTVDYMEPSEYVKNVGILEAGTHL